MSESGETQYVSGTGKDIKIEQDGYIGPENISEMRFTFAPGQEITEGVSDKNAGKKQVVSYTKNGRSAYTPVTVNYPDNSTSSKMVLTGCILQHTEALNAPNHKYAKNFVIIAIPEEYIDKIIADAKSESGINLTVKPNTETKNGFYWMRCNLDKLQKKDTHILLDRDGGKSIELTLDQLLSDFGKSVSAFIVFTLSGSMNSDKMEETLDLENGQYFITMKPTEVWATSDSSVEGPILKDTNNRKNESVSLSGHLFADGALAEFAMKRLKIKG